MKKETKYNQKHLSLTDRNEIEKGLLNNLSLKDIAISISKDPTTVSKEIKKHRIKKDGNFYNGNNNCVNRKDCMLTDICNINCRKKCSRCSLCNSKCKHFIPITCKRLSRFPYTCNGCDKKKNCRSDKYYYRALSSYNSYKTTLSESRQGISITEEELYKLDSIVSPLVKQGLSISYIHSTQDIGCTKSTLYNYIENNYLSIGNLDLPRKVRFRTRKKRRTAPKKSTIRNGRTYEDFLKYIEDNPDDSIVEMDTVEGKKGRKSITYFIF